MSETEAIQIARHDEQIKTLFVNLRIVIILLGTQVILMTLALIYGALGPHGFNAVTTEAKAAQKMATANYQLQATN